jgi:hypothetical protein
MPAANLRLAYMKWIRWVFFPRKVCCQSEQVKAVCPVSFFEYLAIAKQKEIQLCRSFPEKSGFDDKYGEVAI